MFVLVEGSRRIQCNAALLNTLSQFPVVTSSSFSRYRQSTTLESRFGYSVRGKRDCPDVIKSVEASSARMC